MFPSETDAIRVAPAWNARMGDTGGTFGTRRSSGSAASLIDYDRRTRAVIQ